MDCKEMPKHVHASGKIDGMPQHDCSARYLNYDDSLKETITISLEEYKELLITKGKYEELKNQTTSRINFPLSTEEKVVDPLVLRP